MDTVRSHVGQIETTLSVRFRVRHVSRLNELSPVEETIRATG